MKKIEQIANLVSVIASPDEKLDYVYKSIILEAVENAYNLKGNNMRVKDVAYYLNEKSKSQDAVTLDCLNKIVKSLDKCSNIGIYDEYFNSNELQNSTYWREFHEHYFQK